jgi:hypothetical protein
MLIPSFSSKGFPYVRNIVEVTREVIDGPTLVSAYDIHYEFLTGPFTFPSVIFLDSGGYEASKDCELSDVGDKEYAPRAWNRNFHEAVVDKWVALPYCPTITISYDHPLERHPVAEQVTLALTAAKSRPDLLHELLIKPETKEQSLVQMASVLKSINEMRPFHVIGATEKELGSSTLDRMVNIAKLRRALDSVGMSTPIHIFGSLDTISSILYFVSGADIFDGLTWLRYAFVDGYTVYKQNYGNLHLPISTKTSMIDAHCWFKNHSYLKDLELEMQRFASTGDFNAFRHHAEVIRNAHENLLSRLGS